MDGASWTTRDLDCGIAPARIFAWLQDELALSQDPGGAYIFECAGQRCSATATPLGKSVSGGIALERTRLVMEGSAQAVDELMRLFTLRFMSAGG